MKFRFSLLLLLVVVMLAAITLSSYRAFQMPRESIRIAKVDRVQSDILEFRIEPLWRGDYRVLLRKSKLVQVIDYSSDPILYPPTHDQDISKQESEFEFLQAEKCTGITTWVVSEVQGQLCFGRKGSSNVKPVLRDANFRLHHVHPKVFNGFTNNETHILNFWVINDSEQHLFDLVIQREPPQRN